MRYFIVDDSGSMVTEDGHKQIGSKEHPKIISCSRWDELGERIRFHAGLAEALGQPTEFRLLNGSAPRILGRKSDKGSNYEALMKDLKRSPSGGTPLCRHIKEVTRLIRLREQELLSTGQKAVLVICTDGESSDGDLIEAIKPLTQLPCMIVVVLCTDEERISNYWNNIEEQIEIDLDVLDDLASEAIEVHSVNPWLTYAEPLHRMREWGVHMKEMDFIDERALTRSQVHRFCSAIYGRELPNLEAEPALFEAAVDDANSHEPAVFCTRTLK